MAEFLPAIQNTLKWEGGLSKNVHDPGGTTNFGLSQRQYPDLDIENLTEDDAIAIYKRDYWDQGPFEHILDQSVANKVFDMSVNTGLKQATKLTQKAVLACGVSLDVDGEFGPATLEAVNLMPVAELLPELRAECAIFYQELVHQKPGLMVFLRGWLSRAAS